MTMVMTTLMIMMISVQDVLFSSDDFTLRQLYRMLNKIMAHITQPFKTFRAEEPSHQMLQVHQAQGTTGTKYNRYIVQQVLGRLENRYTRSVYIYIRK